jgi:hypothetical protein
VSNGIFECKLKLKYAMVKNGTLCLDFGCFEVPFDTMLEEGCWGVFRGCCVLGEVLRRYVEGGLLVFEIVWRGGLMWVSVGKVAGVAHFLNST